MNIRFFTKKSFLLFFLLLYTLIGIGQEPLIEFDKEWKKAQTYINDYELDLLFEAATKMDKLVANKQSTQFGKVAYLFGEYWYGEEIFSKAKKYFDTAIQLLEKDTAEQLVLAEAYLIRGFTAEGLKNEDESLLYYQKALALKKQLLGHQHERVASIYFNIGEAHQAVLNYSKSDSAFQSGLTILQTIHQEEHVDFADYYEELAYNQSSKDNFKGAISYLKRALLLKEKKLGETDYSLVFPYKYLGRVYREGEYFGEAINYFNKALRILKEQQKRDIYQEAMLYLHIGKSYLKLKDYEKALKYIDQAATIDTSNQFILFDGHLLKGKIASEKGYNEVASKHFDIALNGFARKVKNNKEYLIETNRLITEHQLKISDYHAALKYAQVAIAQGLVTYANQPNNFFQLYLLLGKCHSALDAPVETVHYFSKARSINGGTLNWEFANLTQLKNEVILNLEYADLYIEKQALDVPNLLKTDSILLATIQLVDYITTTYQEKSTKENFIEEYHRVFKKAIRVKYLLYEATQKKQHLTTAFILAEKSKNLILLETLNKVDALTSAVFSDVLIKKEQKLRADITYLENRRFETNQTRPLNEGTIRMLNGQIFELKKQYQTLLKKIEANYPDYFQLKFNATFISVLDIQKHLLSVDQTIIEYFLGDDLIYVFLITQNDFKVVTLPKEGDLITKINQFRESIYSYRPANTSQQKELNKSLITITHQLGFELYRLLIEPFQKELTQKVIIIADGALGYLPFDALITKLPSEDKQLTKPSYLMADYMISYAHSVNWLSGLFKKTAVDFAENFIGVAPVFQPTNGETEIADFRLGLGPLKHNQAEVINIKRSIGGKVIRGVAATRQAFLKYLKEGQILHLATHGKSNDEQGDFSYLAFAEPTDAKDHQFLYVKDLFNLEIPADLVVLSACETGLGEIKRGEGIVGIGKGFSYAGAKSMVTTLWRVNDNSTANFMPLFYEHLKEGCSKDEALWKAKKQFIEKYRNASHPFFWSGYVAYGNMDAIEFQHINWSIPFIIGLILAGIIMLFLLRRFLKKKR